MMSRRGAGNCAGVPAAQLDVLLERKSTAVQLCADCPLQYSCIATLVLSHDRNSCMGGLNREERVLLQRRIMQALRKAQLTHRDVVQYLQAHPEAIAQARSAYRRYKRRERNSRRRREYTREYMRGVRTITSMAQTTPSIILHY